MCQHSFRRRTALFASIVMSKKKDRDVTSESDTRKNEESDDNQIADEKTVQKLMPILLQLLCMQLRIQCYVQQQQPCFVDLCIQINKNT